ncbi:MAG: hypothetical protein V5A55_10105 [Halovenus sp.]
MPQHEEQTVEEPEVNAAVLSVIGGAVGTVVGARRGPVGAVVGGVVGGSAGYLAGAAVEPGGAAPRPSEEPVSIEVGDPETVDMAGGANDTGNSPEDE